MTNTQKISEILFFIFIYRLNGQALIDEDYLRSIGMNDFTKYRCDPLSEPPRMMPKQMPSLLVEEENESLSCARARVCR